MLRAHHETEHPDPDQTEGCRYLDDVRNEIMHLIHSDRTALLDQLVREMPRKTNGKALNISTQATAFLEFTDEARVKNSKLQGEGWDMCLSEVTALLKKAKGEK